MFQVPLNPPLDPQGRFHSKAEKERSTFPAPQGEGPGVGPVIPSFQPCAIKPMNSNLPSNIAKRSIFASPLCPPPPLRPLCFHSKAEKECSMFKVQCSKFNVHSSKSRSTLNTHRSTLTPLDID